MTQLDDIPYTELLEITLSKLRLINNIRAVKKSRHFCSLSSIILGKDSNECTGCLFKGNCRGLFFKRAAK